ncbi:MAG: hypothetical protein WAW37_00450 [Syntrophobacteraceae bacterium]
MSSQNAVLLSIRPKYAQKIFNGTKTVELRRTCPRVQKGNLVLVYVSSPVKALAGFFKISQIIKETPERLWHLVGPDAGISKPEFDNYYSGAAIGFGICIDRVRRLNNPVSLEWLKVKWPGFLPPQSFCYIGRPKVRFDSQAAR